MFTPQPAQSQALSTYGGAIQAMAVAPDGTLYIATGSNLMEYRLTNGRLQQIGRQELASSLPPLTPSKTYHVVPHSGGIDVWNTQNSHSKETKTPDVVVVPTNKNNEPVIIVPSPQH